MEDIAIVGATGAVGYEILKLLHEKELPFTSLRCFASPKSEGKEISFNNKKFTIEILKPGCFKGISLAFFCAGKKISLEWAQKARSEGALVIDSSSAFRHDPSVPLVIPEINGEATYKHEGLIASPNCTTSIMLMALYPLHVLSPIKRIVAATYQAASGAGAKAVEELQDETRAFLENRPFTRSVMPFPYAFNLFTHNSPLLDNGYVEEEMKMVQETRKILENDKIQVTATCVRVPVLRAHSMALNVEFSKPLSLEEIYNALDRAPGVKILEERAHNRFPMPTDATGVREIFCGRIRKDLTQPNTFEFWVVGDQLLKGAALNAVQIAERAFVKCYTICEK